MSEELMERALARATDTKECVIGDGVLAQAAAMFREQFPGADRAIVVCDPRTRAAAGECVEKMLAAAGVEVAEHVLEPGGRTFHADYRYVKRSGRPSGRPGRRGTGGRSCRWPWAAAW